jgi:hypothetical protein
MEATMGEAAGDPIPNLPTEHPEPLVSGGQGHKEVSGAARAEGHGEAKFTGARIIQVEIVQAIGCAHAVAKAKHEHAQWKREPVIAALKRLYTPDGLRPKGTSVKMATDSVNKSPAFRHKKASPRTVARAFKAIESSLKK